MTALAANERDWLLSESTADVHGFYAELGVELPRGTGDEASVRCFANPAAHSHEDRNKSCSVNTLTGLWCCHGCGKRGNPYAAAVAAGYTEKGAAQLARRFGVFLELAKDKPKMATWRDHKRWRDALWAQPALIRRLGELKGWTPYAIQRCGLGWDGERITFTIRKWVGEKYKIVGVARYLPGGSPKMVALPGSKRELFPAPEHMPRDRTLFVVEGEPDAVSVRSAGHLAVAVPGASSWQLEWAARLTGRRLIVLCDCDRQGRGLAARIKDSLPEARVVDLEPGCDDGTDIGDWVAEAAREGGVEQVGRWLDRLVAETEGLAVSGGIGSAA